MSLRLEGREPRVLLVRTSALGDVVHALPVLAALRRHHPGARVAWVVEAGLAPLLEGHPDLDRRIPVRLRTWRRSPLSRDSRDGFREAVAAMRDFAPDVALELMGNHKGGILARLSSAPRVIGTARPLRREPSSALWIGEPVMPPAAPEPLHVVDRGLSLLTALGLPREPADFAGHRLLPGIAAAPAERPYAFLHPGAGWANKIYPAERWGRIARRLAEDRGLEVRVSVAPGEEALARRVVEASGGAARESTGRGLVDLVAELRGARLALGGDTGPIHLAHALETPVLMVMGPTGPHTHGPYGAVERAVWEALPCSFCYKRFGETKACLKVVPAQRVEERALQVLDRVLAEAGDSPRRGPETPPAGAAPEAADRDSLAVRQDSREN